jgi:DNA-directed RNA polymerase subunit H (RpoH/RPB5)
MSRKKGMLAMNKEEKVLSKEKSKDLVHKTGLGINNLRKILVHLQNDNLSHLQTYVLQNVLTELEVLSSDLPQVEPKRKKSKTASEEQSPKKAPKETSVDQTNS